MSFSEETSPVGGSPPATAVPIVAIVRRGPSAWCHLGRWDLATRNYEPGSWIKGTVYPQKCDVSRPQGWVTSVAVTPNGTRVVTTSMDETLKVWDLDTGAVVATFTADLNLEACATLDDRRYCAAGMRGNTHLLDLVGQMAGDI